MIGSERVSEPNGCATVNGFSVSMDVPAAVIANLTQEIQENRSEDPVVAVDDLGCRLDRPEWTVRVAANVFQNCATAESALPILLEMPIRAKLLVKFIEVLSLFAPIRRSLSLISLMCRFLCFYTTQPVR